VSVTNKGPRTGFDAENIGQTRVRGAAATRVCSVSPLPISSILGGRSRLRGLGETGAALESQSEINLVDHITQTSRKFTEAAERERPQRMDEVAEDTPSRPMWRLRRAHAWARHCLHTGTDRVDLCRVTSSAKSNISFDAENIGHNACVRRSSHAVGSVVRHQTSASMQRTSVPNACARRSRHAGLLRVSSAISSILGGRSRLRGLGETEAVFESQSESAKTNLVDYITHKRREGSPSPRSGETATEDGRGCRRDTEPTHVAATPRTCVGSSSSASGQIAWISVASRVVRNQTSASMQRPSGQRVCAAKQPRGRARIKHQLRCREHRANACARRSRHAGLLRVSSAISSILGGRSRLGGTR